MSFGRGGRGGWSRWGSRSSNSGSRNSGGGSSRPRTRSTTATNAGYSPVTSAGRSSTSPGYGTYNTTAHSAYWGDPNYAVSTARTTPSGRTLNSGYYQGTAEGYRGFRETYDPSAGLGAAPALTGGGGGGGGGYGGGGGGGGGAPAMTQAMFDAMLQALGTRGPQLALKQVDLPTFRGQNIPAFNATPYDQLRQQLATAVSRDTAAINQGANQTTNALAAYNANPYAAAAQVAPQMQAQGAALEAGGANAAAAGAAQASANAETGAFNDLMKVLGANYNQAQNSRMAQVQETAQSARNQLGAQNLGLGSQIGMQRANAYQQWQQRDAERRYQNNLMQQQWQREELTRNQDIYNQQAQGNWQQRNEMINNRLTPLLQLIQGTAGAKIDMSALTKLLAGLSR